MTHKKKNALSAGRSELRVSPEKRLVSKFDDMSIAEFPIAPPDKMGLRVKDDCAEEHIM